MSKEAMGRLVLEASAGLHGKVAERLADAWAEMSSQADELQARLDAMPQKSYVNMGAQALAAELAEAVSKDEQSEGLDISAGLFGTHTSAWLRHVAATYLSLNSTEQEITLRTVQRSDLVSLAALIKPEPMEVNGQVLEFKYNDPAVVLDQISVIVRRMIGGAS